MEMDGLYISRWNCKDEEVDEMTNGFGQMDVDKYIFPDIVIE